MNPVFFFFLKFCHATIIFHKKEIIENANNTFNVFYVHKPKLFNSILLKELQFFKHNYYIT